MEYTSRYVRIKAIAMLLLLATMVLVLGGCRSKKKLVEKQDVAIEAIEALEVSESVQMAIKKDSTAFINTETIITNNDETIDVETADTEKEVTITKEEKDGKTVWTGTNVKKLTVSKNDNTATIIDSSKVKVTQVDSSTYNRQEKSNTKLKIDFSETNKKIEVESANVWVSIAIWIILIIAALIALYSLYKKYRNKLPL